MTDFTIKDSGQRQEFDGGMVRDTEDGKIDFTSCLYGPMFRRWMQHTTKGREKYPDREDGTPNWTLGAGSLVILARAKRSAFRHFMSYMNGETDEDHAAGVFFNINLAEFIKDSLAAGFEEVTQAQAATFTDNLVAKWYAEVSEAAPDDVDRSGNLRAQETRDRLARQRTVIQRTILKPTPPTV